MENHRSPKEKTLLGLSLIGGLSIIPFGILRFIRQEYLIGSIDILIILGMLSIFIYAFKSRNVELASTLLVILSLIGIASVFYIKGVEQIYWAYPVTVTIYFLLNPKVGLYIVLCFILILALITFQKLPPLTFSTIFITLIMTNIYAHIFSRSMKIKNQQLLLLVKKDPLTGAGNRHALSDKLVQVIASFKRNHNKVSMLLIDLDHFKKINDNFGHNMGDQFLAKITEKIQSKIRMTDSFFRFGGEEFILITENTNAASARKLAEKMRLKIEQSTINPEIKVTVSIGVAELKTNENSDQWIKRADIAMYKAKELGRNKVCSAD